MILGMKYILDLVTTNNPQKIIPNIPATIAQKVLSRVTECSLLYSLQAKSNAKSDKIQIIILKTNIIILPFQNFGVENLYMIN